MVIYFLLLIGILIALNYEWLQIQIICAIIVLRGILSPDEFWWGVSDLLLDDPSGINLYNRIKSKYKTNLHSLNIFGTNINLVLSHDYLKEILNKSPFVFGPGRLKRAFFASFMPYNLGVSTGCPWIHRRKMNEEVLDTDTLHRYAGKYYEWVSQIIMEDEERNVLDNEYFTKMGKSVTGKIVFGETPIPDEVFQIFKMANSLMGLLGEAEGLDLSDTKTYQVYKSYLRGNINNPKKYSLVWLSTIYEKSCIELMNQIPHWIFPIVGQYINSLPRFYLLLQHYPEVLDKLEIELASIDENGGTGDPGFHPQYERIYSLKYLRSSLLETFRLYNPVVTTFRSLLCDYKFDNIEYKKGDNFLILNHPVLRDPKVWVEANKFVPERWENSEKEESYYAIMFNQGPQECPGKELIIYLLQITIYILWKKNGSLRYRNYYPKLNRDRLPDMINPYKIILQL